MTNDSPHPPLTPEVVRHLQEAVLRAVVFQEPLPGGATPIRLPDLELVRDQDQVMVLDQDLAGPLALPEAGTRLVRVSEEALMERARTRGRVAYLRVYPPEQDADGAIMLTLAASLATADATPVLGLSRLQVRFRHRNGRWLVDGEPVMLAS